MPKFSSSAILPNWPAPANIHALSTTRNMTLGELDLPYKPLLLHQVHGAHIIVADKMKEDLQADGSYTQNSNIICIVKTADCLPILMCNKQGTCVAALHAGWKSLGAGIVESAIEKIPALPEDLLAWFGPAIGPGKFEVGFDVYEKFPENTAAFKKISETKFLCNIYELAKQRLEKLGVKNIYGGTECTYSDADRFYSHRRSKDTGRMFSMIWMA